MYMVRACMVLQLLFFSVVGWTWQQHIAQREMDERVAFLLSLPIEELGDVKVNKI